MEISEVFLTYFYFLNRQWDKSNSDFGLHAKQRAGAALANSPDDFKVTVQL